jgi:very-short-patch-repair endonuclease/ribosomal protein S27AE
MFKRNIDEVQSIINKRLEEINASLLSSLSYKNTKTKFKLKCNVDGHEWYSNYDRLIIAKNKCPRCAGQIIYQEEAQDRVEKRLKEIDASLREPFIYKNCSSRIKLFCNIDGHEWETSYKNFVNNRTGCFKCSKHVLYENEIQSNILKRLKELNVSLRESYIHINNSSELKLICNIDGHEWESKYSNFINNKKGCAKCAKVLKLTQSEAEEKVQQRCKKMNYELIEPFIFKKTSNTRIYLKCNKCNFNWEVSYNNFINRKSGCPKCQESKGENEAERILKSFNMNYVPQKKFEGCKDKDYLKFDFYIPDLNICIEFDGIQHYESFNFFGGESGLKDTQRRDSIKNDFCYKNNIYLIRIPYKDFNKMEIIIKKKLKLF